MTENKIYVAPWQPASVPVILQKQLLSTFAYTHMKTNVQDGAHNFTNTDFSCLRARTHNFVVMILQLCVAVLLS